MADCDMQCGNILDDCTPLQSVDNAKREVCPEPSHESLVARRRDTPCNSGSVSQPDACVNRKYARSQ